MRSLLASVLILFSSSSFAGEIINLYSINAQSFCLASHSPLRTSGANLGCTTGSLGVNACFHSTSGTWFGGGICDSSPGEFGASFTYVSVSCPSGSSAAPDGLSCTCPSGLTFDSSTSECVDLQQQCTVLGATGAECTCPSGTIQGYTSGGTGLVEACINPNPDPEPDACQGKTIIGHVNGQAVCDNLEGQCPSGYNPGIVNGELYCSPNIDDNPECPNGGSYGTVGGYTGCFDPDPNINDPDYPPNSDPDSPSYPGPDPENPTYPNDPNWPSPDNPNYTPPESSDFDDSNIVSELSDLNAKATDTNSKLDIANDKLGEISDTLSNGGDPLPAHTQAENPTYGEASSSAMDRIKSAPIVAGFSGFANMISLQGASCPTFDIDLPPPISANVSTQIHCDLFDSISGVLSAIMITVFSFTGFRIIASA